MGKKGVYRVALIWGIGFVLLIILTTNFVNFLGVRRTIIKDVRDQQLLSFLEASQSGLQSVLERNLAISQNLASDPTLNSWFEGEEKDSILDDLVVQRLQQVKRSGDVVSVFAASAKTGAFLLLNNSLARDILDSNEEDDQWFYAFLKKATDFELNLDFNEKIQKTLFWYNVRMGSAQSPLGIAGIGLDPEEILTSFYSRKITSNSLLWVVDQQGTVQIAQEQATVNHSLGEIVPLQVFQKVTGDRSKMTIPAISWKGKTYEFASMPIGEMPFNVVVAVPQEELLAVLNPIKRNSFFTMLFFFALTVVLVMVGAKKVTNPLVELTGVAEAMSKGDLKKSIDRSLQRRGDEFGSLARAFAVQQQQTKEVIAQANQVMAAISQAGLQLQSTSSELSGQAMQQAGSTEEISASMEEMSANISQNASHAQQSEKLMKQSSEETEKGGEIVHQTILAIKNISQRILVVEEIARQTNIIALNAAVEAAHAGDAGRGFAFVAKEVRKLAERSAEAATYINQVARQSVEVADNAGSIFTNLVPEIQKAFLLVREINAASNEQSAGVGQINQAMMNLDKGSQNNASEAENISRMVDDFTIQTQKLKEVISFFKI